MSFRNSDWITKRRVNAMSETQQNSLATGEPDELDTTPPNPASADTAPAVPQPASPGKWEMPKPVFRRTSGKLASNFEKRAAPEMDGRDVGAVEIAAAGAVAGSATGAGEDNISGSAVNVEPQPELAEVLVPDPLDTPQYGAAPKKKSSSYGLLFTLLGLALILGFIALILAVVYFLFLRPEGSGSLF